MSTQDEMFADMLAAKDAELHPDLAACLVDSVLGPMIKHPLVYDMLPINGWANAKYEYKKEALDKALAASNWHTAVFLHERPYRCDALIDYVLGRDENEYVIGPTTSSPQEVRDLVVDVWTDSENIHQHIEDWMQITDGWAPGQPLLFASAEEQTAFDALPETLTLWRGDCEDGGWSWSLDRSVGEFFAQRFGSHTLLTGTVDKRNVFGYITRRSESEVMVRREHVENIRVVSGNEEEA